MGSDDQVPVVLPGEPLRLALVAAVHPQLVTGAAGPRAGSTPPGDADPAAARAATRTTGRAPRGPRCVLSAASALPLPRPRSRRRRPGRAPSFISGTPRPSTPRPPRPRVPWPGGRSCADHPCRPRRHPQVVRDLVISSPRANRSAACSRSRSRRCCPAGVYPPRCAYRMPRSYARKPPTSRPGLYEFILVISAITRCWCRHSSNTFPRRMSWIRSHDDSGITQYATITRAHIRRS